MSMICDFNSIPGRLGNKLRHLFISLQIAYITNTKLYIKNHDITNWLQLSKYTSDEFNGQFFAYDDVKHMTIENMLQTIKNITYDFRLDYYFFHYLIELNKFDTHTILFNTQNCGNLYTTITDTAIHFRHHEIECDWEYPNSVTPIEYYKKSVLLILENFPNTRFVIFTDYIEHADINIITSFLQTINASFILNTQARSVINDFYNMSNCGNLISAVSSFDEAAGFLGTYKKIIFPKHWNDYDIGRQYKFGTDLKNLTNNNYSIWKFI